MKNGLFVPVEIKYMLENNKKNIKDVLKRLPSVKPLPISIFLIALIEIFSELIGLNGIINFAIKQPIGIPINTQYCIAQPISLLLKSPYTIFSSENFPTIGKLISKRRLGIKQSVPNIQKEDEIIFKLNTDFPITTLYNKADNKINKIDIKIKNISNTVYYIKYYELNIINMI
jgi:hypothetical protein